ncbi:MAG TPA: hypothetical protein VFZ61_08695 [Polyangiales bacterium]
MTTFATRQRAALFAATMFCALPFGVCARSPAAAAAPEAISAVDVATSWVFALKRADSRVLDRTSAYPFELRIQNAPCKCKGGKAGDAGGLTALLSPLMQTEEIKSLEVTTSDAKEVSKGALPDWAKRFGNKLPKGSRLVRIEASGGVVYTLTFVLVVTGNQVRAVWLNAATDGDA